MRDGECDSNISVVCGVVGLSRETACSGAYRTKMCHQQKRENRGLVCGGEGGDDGSSIVYYVYIGETVMSYMFLS